MDIMSINSALHRKLKIGVEFDNLFPKVACKETLLGDGDTTFTLELMKNWATRYQGQTKKIAKRLKKATTVATVQSIYKFLHDHLQYKADGYQQNLRSPACSWKTRKEGIFSKSDK